MDAAPRENLADVDWPHVRVRNVGLPLSPRTRAANGVIAYGTIDGSEVRLNGSSSAPSPPEETDIYGDGFADLPIVVRLNRGDGPPGAFYGNLILPKSAYLTEVEFLTQGAKVPNKIGTHPLTDAVHDLVITTQSLDGAKQTREFRINIPPWPGRISLHRV